MPDQPVGCLTESGGLRSQRIPEQNRQIPKTLKHPAFPELTLGIEATAKNDSKK